MDNDEDSNIHKARDRSASAGGTACPEVDGRDSAIKILDSHGSSEASAGQVFLASGGPRALFIDRYTILVIEKCEGDRRLDRRTSPKLAGHKNLISIKGIGPIGAPNS